MAEVTVSVKAKGTPHLPCRGLGPRHGAPPPLATSRNPDTIRPNDLLADSDADGASLRKPLQARTFTSP